MTNTKMTYGKAIAACIDLLTTGETSENPTEIVEKLTALSESLAKKSGAERKPTATQVANEGYKTEILAYLRDVAEPKTVGDILKEVPAVAGFSTPKVSALMKQLVDDGNGPVERLTDKRRTYFRIKAE